MADKIALVNMKGGVGKSTLAANLAWEMATGPWYRRVLAVDLDPQFNCSQYLMGAAQMETIIGDGSPTVWDIFEQFTQTPGRSRQTLDPAKAVYPIYGPDRQGGSISLIPSRLELSQTLKNPAQKEGLLSAAIGKLEDQYDLIVLDCAPTDSVLTTAAYLTADAILVPVRPEFLSTIGLPLMEKSLAEFSNQHDQAPDILGLVFNAMSNYTPGELDSEHQVREVARDKGWRVFDAQVRYSRSFPSSARQGEPIFWTRYARSKTKQNFHEFAREFAQCLAM